MEEPRRLGGRYELGSVLGRGGMAEVYLAHDTRLGRTVAVKTLRVDLARDPSFQARFRREAQSAASLNHPSIVAVYDTGEDYVDGISIPYIVMEYVDGSTLRELLHSGRKLLPERAMEMTVGILQALEYSHRAGIVHRDIKPANVMLTRTGQVKVMDFGIARAMGDSGMTMTQTAAVIGTAQYLSPEQAKGEQVDARSDLYSTGCLLYELLTVRPPFVGDSPVAVAYQHVREDPQPPSVFDPEVTPAMDAIVLKALTKDPDYRYQSADEMRADVEAALDGQPVAAAVAMGAAGYGYPHGYPDSAPTTALPPQADPHTSMLPPSREDDGGYGYDDRPDRRRQKKSGGASTALLVVAGVLVLIGAIFLGKSIFSGHGAGSDAKVPNFVGKTFDESSTLAGNVDIKLVKGTPEFCNVDKDLVCKQTPAADTAIPSDKTVTLILSKGAAPVAVPDVKNDKVADATTELRNAGFDVKTEDQVSTTKDPGIVVGQNPAAGTKQPKGTVITLKVTVEPEKINVPDLTRFPEQGARDQLSNAGFTNVHVTRQSSDDPNFPNGTVISQTPPGGTSAAKDDTITLVISTGPSQTTQNPPQGQTMPKVQFRRLGQVQDQLNGMNLGLSIVVVNGGPEDRNAWVIGSTPGEGEPLTQGEQIQLQTTAGPGGGGQ
ncbi:Stk1 family PASTA domain-containing Ser/Thr kinase [Actinacidiphila bryophytorum]|uniref:non-specific serine/threonine protein kinase n=1 Tax=Actinacidiphila bryophytorum TaxID=1436133 RepID=A0A9W4MDV4_9ACTN|nr:Stk1 family PASTA domain-containing Ser/Thr kinase [Actinacidiphila bryophytorum]MBM9437353.1 Stk1 family PASTA domain-containing Ser/Thr kinase [Actinacidiphila bryophytorum]MBN6545893.1 Stk1 family PASTA domain-containing Ser/Thr kinase [Actinacidiphila bryophytorum]CAG7651750.1 Non-specific serine/threonine protein kinase [Actinacidiphila bryophytorum]